MQKKDCIPILYCRLCNSKKLNKVFDLGETPLANSYSKIKVSKNLKRYPLGLNLCSGCGHLQLTYSIKPEKMFSNYLYKTNTSIKNLLHFENYAKEVNKIFKKKEGKILDIASNDGTFLNFFKKKKFFRLGIDPAKNLKKIANKKGIMQIDDFFTKKNSKKIKKKYGKFDIITANHVCAHVNNLDDFFQGVKNLLNYDGIFIFEVSYRGSVVKKNTFDIIYHEHLDYHALYPIFKFIKKYQFYLNDFKITEAQGGSLRVYVSNKKNFRNEEKIKKHILKERKILKLFKNETYENFKKNINLCKQKLNLIIKKLSKKKCKIAGYGAAAKTTTLLNYFNLCENKDIRFIFDDNVLKQSLYIPGTKIKIISPKNIYSKNFDILIIFAWNYSDVIIKKLNKNKKFTKRGGKFLIPFPVPKIIND